jgi:hypothetical protein
MIVQAYSLENPGKVRKISTCWLELRIRERELLPKLHSLLLPNPMKKKSISACQYILNHTQLTTN